MCIRLVFNILQLLIYTHSRIVSSNNLCYPKPQRDTGSLSDGLLFGLSCFCIAHAITTSYQLYEVGMGKERHTLISPL